LTPEERKKARQQRFGTQLDDSQKKELRKQKFGTANSVEKKPPTKEQLTAEVGPPETVTQRTRRKDKKR
jgi:hypothetical protein